MKPLRQIFWDRLLISEEQQKHAIQCVKIWLQPKRPNKFGRPFLVDEKTAINEFIDELLEELK